eukprot:3289048-Pyramimonas_sp.AAC.1
MSTCSISLQSVRGPDAFQFLVPRPRKAPSRITTSRKSSNLRTRSSSGFSRDVFHRSSFQVNGRVRHVCTGKRSVYLTSIPMPRGMTRSLAYWVT